MVEIVGLISGGKDSIYNLIECVRNGHKIVALANLKPPKQKEELDSFMYQTVGNNLIEIIANECLQLPLFQIEIKGTAESKDEHYRESKNDEVEDLYQLLKSVKESIPTIKGVSCGAILSTYQRIRVENVCSRLGLVCYSYLWWRDQDQLLQEMIESQLTAVIIKVASMGLVPSKHLLKSIQQLYPILKSLNTKFGVHICGEGGEYESIVVDCPLYKKKISIDQFDTIIHSDDAFSQVAYCSIQKYSTTEKSQQEINDQQKYLNSNFIKRNNLNLKTYKENKLQDINNFSKQQQQEEEKGKLQLLEIKKNENDKVLFNYNLKLNQSNDYFSISSYSTINNDTSNLTTGELLEKVLNEISNLLKENSLSIEHLLYCNLYLNDMNDFGNVNQSYYKFFNNLPASRACIQVSLNDQNKRFLIDCFGCTNKNKKSILHVQSISNWAPACIGPYSQTNIFNDEYLFLAGQIAMVPCNLDLNLIDSYDDDDDDNKELLSNDQIQLEQILLNTNNLLNSLNVDYSSVIQSSIFISNNVSTIVSNSIYKYLKEFLIQEGVNQNTSLIQLFKVPKLPKNANIEILFTLYKEKNQDDLINNEIEFEKYKSNKTIENDLIKQFNQLSTNNEEPSLKNYQFNFKISKSISYIHSNLSINDLNLIYNQVQFSSLIESYINEFLLNLQSTLKKSKKSIVYIKFYYLENLYNYNLINLLNQFLPTNYNPSYIPVNEINSNGSNNINNLTILQSELFIN